MRGNRVSRSELAIEQSRYRRGPFFAFTGGESFPCIQYRRRCPTGSLQIFDELRKIAWSNSVVCCDLDSCQRHSGECLRCDEQLLEVWKPCFMFQTQCVCALLQRYNCDKGPAARIR